MWFFGSIMVVECRSGVELETCPTITILQVAP